MTLGWAGLWPQVVSAGGMEGAGVQSPASHGGEHRDLDWALAAPCELPRSTSVGRLDLIGWLGFDGVMGMSNSIPASQI